MTTRLKKSSMPEQEPINDPINNPPPNNGNNNDEDDVDEKHGNIKGLIDYSYDKKIKKRRKNSRKRKKQSLSISDFMKIMMEQHYNKILFLNNYILYQVLQIKI